MKYGLNAALQHFSDLAKINLDNKTCSGYPDGYCLRKWALQYVGLQPKPTHNSTFSFDIH
jgi:hypothetical protein